MASECCVWGGGGGGGVRTGCLSGVSGERKIHPSAGDDLTEETPTQEYKLLKVELQGIWCIPVDRQKSNRSFAVLACSLCRSLVIIILQYSICALIDWYNEHKQVELIF